MSKITDKIEKLFTMQDCKDCYASKAGGTIIDVLHPITGLTVCYGKTLAETREEYPDAEKMTVDAFCEWKAEQQHTPIEWNPSTQERYDEMLGCLPPAAWVSGGFLVGEPWDHDAGNGQPRYDGFRQVGEKFYCGSRPMTIAEFRGEVEKAILAS